MWAKKNKRKFAAIIVVVLIIAFVLRPQLQNPIETQTVKRGDLVVMLSASGSIDAQQTATLSFLTSGKLVYLGAKKGDKINQYQTIAALDQRTVQKNLENALIDYSKKRNTFDQTIDDFGGRTPKDALNIKMRRILEDNQYDLNKSVISVELEDLVKQQSFLVSPISGYLTHSDVSVAGENITNATKFVVSDLDNVEYKMEVDEADIGKIKTGQKVILVLDAYPSDTLVLNIDSIDYASNITTTGGTVFTVSAKIPDNKDIKYRIGMNGDGQIVIEEKKNVLYIPGESILDDKYVFVKKGKEYEKKEIIKGSENDTDTEIKDGVAQNEEVALQPAVVQNMQNNTLWKNL